MSCTHFEESGRDEGSEPDAMYAMRSKEDMDDVVAAAEAREQCRHCIYFEKIGGYLMCTKTMTD